MLTTLQVVNFLCSQAQDYRPEGDYMANAAWAKLLISGISDEFLPHKAELIASIKTTGYNACGFENVQVGEWAIEFISTGEGLSYQLMADYLANKALDDQIEEAYYQETRRLEADGEASYYPTAEDQHVYL